MDYSMMMSGLSPYGSMMNNDLMMAPFINNYQNTVAAQDAFSSLSSASDAMSMNGSIFPSFTGSSTGSFDYDKYYKEMQQNQERMAQNQIQQSQNWRNVSFMTNAPTLAIQGKARILNTKIIEDEQEQIIDAFNALKNAVRAACDPNGEASDEYITEQAQEEYKKLYGKELTEEIQNKSNGSFKQGFLQTVTFGIHDGSSAAENVSKITGVPVGREQERLKKMGNAAGGATLGSVGMFALSRCKWLFKTLSMSKTAWASLAGLVGGAITASAVSQSHG